MTALMRVGDEASVKAMLPYLRAQDAGLRAAAIEASAGDCRKPSRRSCRPLLSDGDSDVRLLATELARNMQGVEATPACCAR